MSNTDETAILNEIMDQLDDLERRIIALEKYAKESLEGIRLSKLNRRDVPEADSNHNQ